MIVSEPTVLLPDARGSRLPSQFGLDALFVAQQLGSATFASYFQVVDEYLTVSGDRQKPSQSWRALASHGASCDRDNCLAQDDSRLQRDRVLALVCFDERRAKDEFRVHVKAADGKPASNEKPKSRERVLVRCRFPERLRKLRCWIVGKGPTQHEIICERDNSVRVGAAFAHGYAMGKFNGVV
jgi:hypothetical protein